MSDIEKHVEKINVNIKSMKKHKKVKTWSVTGVITGTLRLSGCVCIHDKIIFQNWICENMSIHSKNIYTNVIIDEKIGLFLLILCF